VVFGRAADRLERGGRSALPLMAAGVAVASLSLAMLILGLKSLFLWCLFAGAATAVVLGYSILSRRYPKAMAGRANTAINVFAFVGSFLGQWGIGLILDLWPQSGHGYAAQAYPWALGAVWTVQLAGLAWLWLGRELLAPLPTRAA
jgi:MFS family permease